LLVGKATQTVLDLQGKFARRRKDNGACSKPGGTRGRGDQVLQQRQGECGGLAGSSLGDAEQIAALEQMWDGACLDGGWFNKALARERAQQRLGQTEAGEGIQWHEVDAPAPANAWVVAETGALMFACPRDNGANALEPIFREGSPS
jgi:hypothetical protein